MAIKEPPAKFGNKEKEVKANKSFLGDALEAKMRQMHYADDGRQLTVAQMIAERLANIAVYAESNTDAVAASKLIYDRVLGRAAVAKQEETRQMPKVVFSLTEEGLEKVNRSAAEIIQEAEIEDEDGEGLVVAEIDGRTFVG